MKTRDKKNSIDGKKSVIFVGLAIVFAALFAFSIILPLTLNTSEKGTTETKTETKGSFTGDYSNWMGDLVDARYASTVSIPFSHDTACWDSNLSERGLAISPERPLAVTQDRNIQDQWNNGARGFDFRTYWEVNTRAGKKGNVGNAHGATEIWWESKTLFADLFGQLIDQLKAHPKEFAVVRMMLERDVTKGNYNAYSAAINSIMSSYSGFIYTGDYNDATVGDLRGKMLIFTDHSTSKGSFPSGYSDPMSNWGPNVATLFKYGSGNTDNYNDVGVVEAGFDDISAHSVGKDRGWGWSQTNVPAQFSTSLDFTPRSNAPSRQVPLADYINSHTNLSSVGVVGIDFVGTEFSYNGSASVNFANTIIGVNFRTP
jgi:hypothetical protein